jgi:hypothetical protein
MNNSSKENTGKDVNDDKEIQNLKLLERRRRSKIAMAAFPLLISIVIVLDRMLKLNLFEFLIQRPYVNNILDLVMLSCFLLSGFSFLMIYLQQGFSKINITRASIEEPVYETKDSYLNLESIANVSTDQLAHITKDINELRKKIQIHEDISLNFSEEQKIELANVLKDKVKSETSDQILQELRENVTTSMNIDIRVRDINNLFKTTLYRLRKERCSLSHRGNLNLSIGIVTTISGLLFLGYFVLNRNIKIDDPLLYTSYIVPRLSFVVFIEIFAYFFLKLYKSSLSEIKYFQNEMTNVESKYISFLVASRLKDEKIFTEIIKDLVMTERNYVLEKGQTTVDLEKIKAEKETFSDIVPKILDFANKNK